MVKENTGASGIDDQFASIQLLDRDVSITDLAGNPAELLSGGGEFFFVDNADLFTGEPSVELMRVVDQLRARGIKIVILTSNNPDRLETTDLADEMTSTLGIGSEADGTLNPKVLVCIFNSHTSDNAKEVLCDTGELYDGVLTGSILDRGIDLIIAGYKNGNMDEGYKNAYEYFEQAFQERDAKVARDAEAKAASQAQDQAATDSQVSNEAGQASDQTVQPSQIENFVKENQTGITNVSLSAVIMMALVGLNAVTKPKRIFVSSVEKSRRAGLDQFMKLKRDMSIGLNSFQQINSTLKASYPKEAQISREEKQEFDKRLDSLQEDQAKLVAAKVGYWRGKPGMEVVRESAKAVREEAMSLLRIIDEKQRQAGDLLARKEGAQKNTDLAGTKLTETEDWYKKKLDAFRAFLPPVDEAFNAIQNKHDEAVQNSYYQPEFALKGSDQAVEVTNILGKFIIAVEAFTHGSEVSMALLRDSQLDLKKWPGQAIDSMQLASSGVQLLDEAKAGIVIPDKLENVVSLSEAAEVEFKHAKDFSSATATVLNLQDENNIAIEEIFSKGFDERHIQDLKEAAAKALSEANDEASQGNWQEAHLRLDTLRVKTNKSLAEMQRLEQLHKKNTEDLENLVKEVAETKKTYYSETQDAWTDLDQNFTPDNFNESAEIWDLLKEDLSVEEAIDFRGHFLLIATVLKEVTDVKDDELDIATIAENKNSLKEQEFDEAATLIRTMEKQLSEAQGLMHGLLERQKLARKAQDNYEASIDNAKSRLQLARESIDTPEEDRLVGVKVDDQIEKAAELIELAKKAGEGLVFVAAFEAASKATGVAIQARENAEGQIKVLQGLYSDLASHKEKSLRLVGSEIEDVNNEHDTVIMAATTRLVLSLEQAVSKANDKEKGLAVFEDHALAEEINSLLADYESIDRLRSQLNDSFESDKESYQSLLDDLDSAISDANGAISSASTRCGHSDAGGSGRGSLSSARGALPSSGSWGDKRSDIKSDIGSAEQAESYADTAYSQASSAIAAAEAERRRIAAEKAAREAREAAAKRAKEAAERREENNRRAQRVAQANNRTSKKF